MPVLWMSVTCSALAAAETGDLVGHGGEPLLTAGEQDEGWDLGTQPLTPQTQQIPKWPETELLVVVV